MTHRTAPLIALLAVTLTAASPAVAQTPQTAKLPKTPRISAPSAIVVEESTGDVLFSRAPDSRRPIASTTKLMTALLTLENADLDDVFTAVPYSPLPAESIMGLRAGEKLKVRDLMAGLLLASANDAAVTLANGVSGSTAAFVKLMNRRARKLGLENTSFANPIGLDDPKNFSTARDLATLALAVRKERFARKTADKPRALLRSGSRQRTVVNRNSLVRSVPFVNGMKTGRTIGAGFLLVGSGTRKGVTVVSVVMGEPTEAARNAESIALLRYGVKSYSDVVALKRGQRVAEVPIRDRETESVPVVAGDGVRQVVRRGREITRRLQIPDVLEGPIAKGTRVGTIVVLAGGKAIGRVAARTGADVPEAGLAEKLQERTGFPVGLALVTFGVLCSLSGAMLLRRGWRRRNAGTTPA